MNDIEIKNRVEELVKSLLYYSEQYYKKSSPVVSDQEYDRLYNELKSLESKYPQFIFKNSPTQIVETAGKGAKTTIKHEVPMLSLDNIYSEGEVAKFVNKVAISAQSIGVVDYSYNVEPKMDGAALSVVYDNGELMIAATRGDGQSGEDVTAVVKTIQSLPKTIPHKGKLFVRGEVFMPKLSFEKLNKERANNELPLFANPRNAAAGSLKLLDIETAAARGLDIFIYGIDSDIGSKTHAEDLQRCKELGFPINPYNKICRGESEIIEHLHKIESLRYALDYDIDGAVIKVNEYLIRQEMGVNAKSPKWATAYKYPAQQATTVVENVIFQVGRTGAITPVAELTPVKLSGSVVSRATLHNEDEIKRVNIKIGDHVFIEKGGEIIPKVVSVILEKRTGAERDIVFPDTCPECGKKIVKIGGEARHRCINPKCPARVKAWLKHFVSRDAMDIEGFGETLIEQLVSEGRLKELSDIYSLTVEELAKRDKMGDLSATKLVNAIKLSLNQPFTRVLFAMGLPLIGEKSAKKLAHHFHSMDKIVNANADELKSVDDIGDKTAELLVNFFKTEEFQLLYQAVVKSGLKLEVSPDELGAGGTLSGMSFLITGTLSKPRKEVETLIEKNGGKLLSAVSKNLNYLVVGDKPGSKVPKAEKLGVKIITEDELINMI